ncbi:P-loop containing nucleoside triphosphate hydrolase protein [Jimgerdemannia flammicorona]|uniref:P-loop containing nucleoside triphosphate hydrolase protein n=1 Tax=Jimgerdemannia flammicorona TaxID=994334 RepID=A0A433D8Z5_9FUNG|nr:P-loop containing nucleoside triphosphate hydrolase protein [Jimgerdemannia flammicorona]
MSLMPAPPHPLEPLPSFHNSLFFTMSPPMCQCGKPATRYETKKPGPNQGRYFFKCASRKCSLFKWDDTTPAAVTNDATTDSTQPSPVHQNIPSWATPPEPDAAKPKRITAGGGGNSTVTFSIHSPTHLSLTARHCPSLIPVLRTIPNSTWEAASQTSFLPLSLPAYNSAVNHLREAQDIKVKIVPLDPHLLRTLSQDENPETKNRRMARTLQVEEEIRAKVRPEGLWEKLMPFQKEGVVEAVVRGGRVLLGDEMGLGKTIQSLTLCSFYSAHWPALILCPSSLRLTWRGEITQWLDVREDEVHVVFTGKDGIEGGSEGGPRKERKKAKSRSKAEGKAKKRKVVYSDEGEQETEEEEEKEEEEEETEVEKARPKKFVIMSYDLVSKYEKQLAEKRFQIVIADESHFLKNREVVLEFLWKSFDGMFHAFVRVQSYQFIPTLTSFFSFQTKRTKAVLPILQSARYVFLLSGTPAFSRPVELWTQLHVLDHQAFSTFFSFAKRYCDAKQGKYGWDYTGGYMYARSYAFIVLRRHDSVL